MIIKEVYPNKNYTLKIVSDDGRVGLFDASPYLEYEAFTGLNSIEEFSKIMNGEYFIEWDCGADLSADTIEAHLKPIGN